MISEFRMARIQAFLALKNTRWVVGSQGDDGGLIESELPCQHRQAQLPAAEFGLIRQRLGAAGDSALRVFSALGQSEWFLDPLNEQSMLVLPAPSRWGALRSALDDTLGDWIMASDSPLRQAVVIGVSSGTGGILAVLTSKPYVGHVVWLDPAGVSVIRMAASLEHMLYGMVSQPIAWARRVGLYHARDDEADEDPEALMPTRFLFGTQRMEDPFESDWFMELQYPETADWNREQLVKLKRIGDEFACHKRVRTASGSMTFGAELDPFGMAELSCRGSRQPLVTAIGAPPLALNVMTRLHASFTANFLPQSKPFWRCG